MALLAPLVGALLSWSVVLLAAAVASCVAVGAWFAGGRAPASLATLPLLLASLALLAATTPVPNPGDPLAITSIAGVPIVATQRWHGFVEARPTPQGVAIVLVAGGAFLLATRRLGGARPPLRVDADGLTWWPEARHRPRLAITVALGALLAAWVLGATDRDVTDPAFSPSLALTPLHGALLAAIAALVALAATTGAASIRRVRVTTDAVELEPARGAPIRVALLDLAYASAELQSWLRRRSLTLHVGPQEVRRAVVVPADGSTDDDVERVRAAITEARLRASRLPAELPEPPAALTAMRQSPASRRRTISLR